MASNKLLDPIFNWGDTVIIKENAPTRYKPGFIGSVCGIRTIESPEIAMQFDAIMGSKLYLIEFNNGEAIEIPGILLTDPDKT